MECPVARAHHFRESPPDWVGPACTWRPRNGDKLTTSRPLVPPTPIAATMTDVPMLIMVSPGRCRPQPSTLPKPSIVPVATTVPVPMPCHSRLVRPSSASGADKRGRRSARPGPCSTPAT